MRDALAKTLATPGWLCYNCTWRPSLSWLVLADLNHTQEGLSNRLVTFPCHPYRTLEKPWLDTYIPLTRLPEYVIMASERSVILHNVAVSGLGE